LSQKVISQSMKSAGFAFEVFAAFLNQKTDSIE
jgi:hypothetical protein